MPLAELIADPAHDIAAVSSYLDGLDPSARWAQLARLSRDQQRDLYARAEGRPVDLQHFVGAAGPLSEVIHDGRNTLPLPSRWRLFQKYFCRDDDPGHLIGFNEGPTRRLIGPGYFVAVPAEGSVVFDYDRRPTTTPPSWPRLVPNTEGLQKYVFRGTHDVLRGVSEHVCIGAVFRGDKPMDHYFVLCRRA
jgi:hypothetical protein